MEVLGIILGIFLLFVICDLIEDEIWWQKFRRKYRHDRER
jgi:hypothetical protein